MATAVMRPLARDDSMQRKWIDGGPTKVVVNQFIKPNDRLTSFERLEIYNRQYWFRIRQCFYEDYPGLRAILGDKKFEKLGDAYLEKFPSRSFTLRNLGSRLVKFLEAKADLPAQKRQLALDMARLEWAHIEAFDNAERKPLGPEDLLEPGPDLRLVLQPYVRLLALQYPVDELRVQLNEHLDGHSAASNAVRQAPRHPQVRRFARLKPQPIYLAVHRVDFTVYYRRLDADEFRLLEALRDGQSIGQALDSVELEHNIQTWFANWAQLGWLCSQP